MTADVQLDNVSVRFGEFVAARNVNLHINEGEFFTILGPSGCGKTTLLRAVSGFLEPSEGRVLIGGVDMGGIGPNRRPTALIFQNLALFPLMSVWENITFSLEVKGVSKRDRRARADELLELIALSDQGEKMVNELSGGQRQRVAIARALAAEPSVLLLDEPLSALDLKLRQHMRTELRAIQQRVGVTFIYITHDQGEALTMSDHVAVMRDGEIEQVSDGTTLYDHPASAFVASFVGENNLFTGTVRESDSKYITLDTASGPIRALRPDKSALANGDDAFAFVRPESLRMTNEADAQESGNTLKARITNQEFEGNLHQIFLEVDGSELPVKLSMVNDRGVRAHETGDRVTLSFADSQVTALPVGPLAQE